MPTEIISDTTKVFKFYDLFDNDESNFCEVTINVKELLYENGNKFYDISYTYAYTGVTGNIVEDSNRTNGEDDEDDVDRIYEILEPYNPLNLPRSNPFYYIYHKRNNIEVDSLEGVIVAKNSMTDEMIKFLLMEYEEMDKHIGNTWGVQYKANIMHSLALLWD
jgi:hypothetical protein